MDDINKDTEVKGSAVVDEAIKAPAAPAPKVEAPAPTEVKEVVSNTPEAPVMVSVDAAKLDRLLEKVATLESNQKQYEKTASQDQIAKIEALRRSGKLVKNVKLRSIDGKYIVGWKMIKDDVWMEGNVLKENQIVKVFFEDATDKELNYRDFIRIAAYFEFEVISQKIDNTGQTQYEVEDKQGKNLTINEKYVN